MVGGIHTPIAVENATTLGNFNRCRIGAGAADFADAGHGAVGPGPGAALAESPRCPLRVPDSVTLVSLPPYSRNLDPLRLKPMESVWEHLRVDRLTPPVRITHEATAQASKRT